MDNAHIRPHGQHSVVLAEDAPRYTEFRGERGGGDMGSVPASSHQIYLTFPAESTFQEEDVATYFGYIYVIYISTYIYLYMYIYFEGNCICVHMDSYYFCSQF